MMEPQELTLVTGGVLAEMGRGHGVFETTFEAIRTGARDLLGKEYPYAAEGTFECLIYPELKGAVEDTYALLCERYGEPDAAAVAAFDEYEWVLARYKASEGED
jgi:hypothetical protein